MDEAGASKTALRVAMRRAAHQVVDWPLVFEDPLAVRIVGELAAVEIARTPRALDKPSSGSLRAFLVARSRYAEDQLGVAYGSGVRQYCLLGAGLDTFAYRNGMAGLRVFEVDHPATQRWKREMLAAAGIGVPETVGFVPVDFERQELRVELGRAGFRLDEACFFGWLGVVPYLTVEAFRGTVAMIAGMPRGSGVTFDYGLPRESLSEVERKERDSLSARVAAAGEPFRLFFTPGEVRLELGGFEVVEDLDPGEIAWQYFSGREDGLGLVGSAAHLVTAWVQGVDGTKQDADFAT